MQLIITETKKRASPRPLSVKKIIFCYNLFNLLMNNENIRINLQFIVLFVFFLTLFLIF